MRRRRPARVRHVVFASLCVAATVGGCANSRSHPAPVSVQPAPGTAALYVLNMSEPTLITSENSLYDGPTKIATLPEQRYLVLQLAPGHHALTCPGLPLGGSATVDAVAGETYYLEIAMGAVNKVQRCGFLAADDAQVFLRRLDPAGQK